MADPWCHPPKAMFIMLDDGAHRAGYLEGHPVLENRIIFMRNGRNESYGAILELNDAAEEQRSIDEGARAGYLVRSDADSPWLSDEENRARAAAALGTGAHFISSDFPGPNDQRAFFFRHPLRSTIAVQSHHSSARSVPRPTSNQLVSDDRLGNPCSDLLNKITRTF